MPSLIVVILSLIISVTVWFIRDKFLHKNLPPGPPRIPILGNVLHFGIGNYRKDPFIVCRQLCKLYGSMVSLKIGLVNVVAVDDYETIKKILNDDNWEDRHNDGAITGSRSFGKPLGIIFANGPMWKEIRKFTIKTLRDFGFGKKGTMQAFINDELTELIFHIDTLRQTNENVINIKRLFTVPVLNILWSVVGGARFENKDARLLKLIEIIDEMCKASPIGNGILAAFPFLRHVAPESTGYTFHVNGNRNLHNFFREVMHERRCQGTFSTDQNDFIDVFLHEIDRNKKIASNPNYFTDEQFLLVLMDLFMAGSETTSNTLEFAIQYMIFNPLVQKKVQAEIDEKVGEQEFPMIMQKHEMPYTEATLWEVQRMACVLPLVGRSAVKDCDEMGYKIPSRTIALLNIYSVHNNEKYWEDPLVFRPERFLDKNNKIDVLQTQKVLAFGGGKRVCIGLSITRDSLFAYFVMLLKTYNFKLCKTFPLPSQEPDVGFTLSPKSFKTVVTKRFEN